MRRIKKLNGICLALLVFLFIYAHSLNASIIQIEGEMGSTATAYVKRMFSSYQQTKNLIYRMYLPQSFSEGINTQIVTKLRKSFANYPTEINEFTDEYGNIGLELLWNKEIRFVQLDLQFTVQTFSSFTPVNSNARFPVTVHDEAIQFLISTDMSPTNDFYINYIGRSLSKNLSREIDVVTSIFLWVDKNIRLSPSSGEYDALSVLKRREGNEKGICNLIVALFKGLGIPSRVVYGFSFQKEVQVKIENTNIVYDLPNSERYWVEVFFPDTGWVSYDPRGMYFGTIPHVIKLSVGPDSDYVSEKWSVEMGEINVQKEFIFDIKTDTKAITYLTTVAPDIDKLILSPPLPDFNAKINEPDLNIEGLQRVSPDEESEETGILYDNSDIVKSLDIDATRKRVYAQKIMIDFTVLLKEVRLPLLKFADEGKIWVEFFTDEDGIPGKLLFRTYSINSSRVGFMMMDNPWLVFPFGNKPKPQLEFGNYWFMLRSSGSCIFNWFATEGNVIGEKNDTIYRDVGVKKLNWNNILNYDMNFQLIVTQQ